MIAKNREEKVFNLKFSLQLVFEGDFAVWLLIIENYTVVVANWKKREIVHVFSLDNVLNSQSNNDVISRWVFLIFNNIIIYLCGVEGEQ